MSFKPKQNNQSTQKTYKSDYKYPEPKAGNRPGRVSLIVDMGEQNREPFENEDGTLVELKPVQQVAVFADLTADIRDYGGDIGEQPYRLMLNTVFDHEVKGITFAASPPKQSATKDTWTFHSGSKLTKLARATGQTQILQDGPNNMDIAQLLGKAAMFEVEVTKNESPKLKDDKGNPVVFTNVKCKGISSCPEMPDGSEYPVAAMKMEPMFISFENATEETVKFIRKDLRETIKKANDYQGSAMQKAIEAFEAGYQSNKTSSQQDQTAQEPKDNGFDDFDDDIPF